MTERLDRIGAVREHLQLEDGEVVRPHQVCRFQAGKMGQVARRLQAGVGYWAESPESGPEGFRFRLQANFVLPKP